MAVKSTNAQKLHILNMINERKDVLFGSFSNSISKYTKNDAWNKILVGAKAIGVSFPPAKDNLKYLRDSWWPNIKNPAVIHL